MNNYSVMSFSVPGAFNPIKLKSLFLTSQKITYLISFTPTISSCSTRSYCLELQSVARMRNSRMQIETLILRNQEAPQCPVTWNGLIGKKRLDSWWDYFSIYVLWTTADCSVVSSYPEPIMIQTIGCTALTYRARFSRASSLEEFVTRFSS